MPLGKVDKHSIAIIEEGIEQFYGLKAVIDNHVALTQDLLANIGTRYEGTRILDMFRSKRYQF